MNAGYTYVCSKCACVIVCVYACLYVCLHVYVCMYVCMSMCMNAFVCIVPLVYIFSKVSIHVFPLDLSPGLPQFFIGYFFHLFSLSCSKLT